MYALCGQQFRGYSCRSWSLNEGRLGCRSHMFESSFFSARSAYKKLLELCAGTPNRHFLRRLLVQLGWLAGCPCEAYTSCPLSNRLKNQLLSRKVKYTICKILRFTTRAVKALPLSLCQPESDLSHPSKKWQITLPQR